LSASVAAAGHDPDGALIERYIDTVTSAFQIPEQPFMIDARTCNYRRRPSGDSAT
jgi:hypothetical protein